jgi:hypothetical protein
MYHHVLVCTGTSLSAEDAEGRAAPGRAEGLGRELALGEGRAAARAVSAWVRTSMLSPPADSDVQSNSATREIVVVGVDGSAAHPWIDVSFAASLEGLSVLRPAMQFRSACIVVQQLESVASDSDLLDG